MPSDEQIQSIMEGVRLANEQTGRLYARIKKLDGMLRSIVPAVKRALAEQPARPRPVADPPGNLMVSWYTGRDNAELLLALAGEEESSGCKKELEPHRSPQVSSIYSTVAKINAALVGEKSKS